MSQLALFEEPASVRKLPDTILRSAVLEDTLRFELRRQWSQGKCIGWVGWNPSYADETRDDMTVSREMGFSCRWGFGSMIKLNIYPFRSTDPKGLDPWLASPEFKRDFARNIRESVAALVECSTVVAAWGNGPARVHVGEYLFEVERRLPSIVWHCLGFTGDGSPIHTLARGKMRVPDDAELVVWRSPS